MRTIAEIKKSMTDEIMADQNLVQRLSLDTLQSWDAQVSAVSVLNLIIYIVAVGHGIMERMLELFFASKRVQFVLKNVYNLFDYR